MDLFEFADHVTRSLAESGRDCVVWVEAQQVKVQLRSPDCTFVAKSNDKGELTLEPFRSPVVCRSCVDNRLRKA